MPGKPIANHVSEGTGALLRNMLLVPLLVGAAGGLWLLYARSQDIRDGRHHPRPQEIHDPAPAGPWREVQLLVASDNQFHHIHGLDDVLPGGEWADRAITPVAQRPLWLDLLAPAALRALLDSLDGAERSAPLLHLGDGGNVACADELSLLTWTLSRAQVRWFFAPGNHDSFFFGNFSPPRDYQEPWLRGLEGPSPIGRGAALAREIPGWVYGRLSSVRLWDTACATLPSRVVELPDGPPPRGPLVPLLRLSRRAAPPGSARADKYAVMKLAQSLCSEHPFSCQQVTGSGVSTDPFILQEVRLSPLDLALDAPRRPALRLLVLDTTDASDDEAGKDLSVTGKAGLVGRRQIAELQRRVRAHPEDTYVVAGHHPLSHHESSIRGDLAAVLAAEKNILFYLSAHTHEVHLWRHPGGLIELNNGSTTDAPNVMFVLGFRLEGGRWRAEARLHHPWPRLCDGLPGPPPAWEKEGVLRRTWSQVGKKEDRTAALEAWFRDRLAERAANLPADIGAVLRNAGPLSPAEIAACGYRADLRDREGAELNVRARLFCRLEALPPERRQLAHAILGCDAWRTAALEHGGFVKPELCGADGTCGFFQVPPRGPR